MSIPCSAEWAAWCVDPQTALTDLCEAILDGETQTNYARRHGLRKSTLGDWIAADSGRSARVREARRAAASTYADDALKVIQGATDPFSLAKAKEEAHHLRWRASKADPGQFGDKLDVSQTVTLRSVPDAELKSRAETLLAIVKSYQPVEPSSSEVSENTGLDPKDPQNG